jgi:hypothetical protein
MVNRVLRRIFGPKRDEVTGDERKLHSEELHNFTLLQIQVEKSSQGGREGQSMQNEYVVMPELCYFH